MVGTGDADQRSHRCPDAELMNAPPSSAGGAAGDVRIIGEREGCRGRQDPARCSRPTANRHGRNAGQPDTADEDHREERHACSSAEGETTGEEMLGPVRARRTRC